MWLEVDLHRLLVRWSLIRRISISFWLLHCAPRSRAWICKNFPSLGAQVFPRYGHLGARVASLPPSGRGPMQHCRWQRVDITDVAVLRAFPLRYSRHSNNHDCVNPFVAYLDASKSSPKLGASSAIFPPSGVGHYANPPRLDVGSTLFLGRFQSELPAFPTGVVQPPHCRETLGCNQDVAILGTIDATLPPFVRGVMLTSRRLAMDKVYFHIIYAVLQ